ncbi:MAG TPA: aromatic-ring-hydroxylating dioxygenase subunit beta [Caldimonas sp.]|jgi:3-phenylpropionate/cinnamic acid dioxygenase small subunit
MKPDRDLTERELADFVVREARLLDEKRYQEWNALFAEDAIYWVPLVSNQPEGLDHTSHLYEDKLLRELRIERLKSPRAFSQQPPTRSLHLLQTPTVEADDAARPDEHVVRTVFQYIESQGDETNTFFGVCWHRIVVDAGGALRLTQKRVDLINSDAALPAVQLFI